MSFLKRMLKRPFTSTELHAMAAQHLAKPPLPESMYEAAATLVGKKGISLLDYWRTTFAIQLDEIAGQKTWQGQRAKLLKIVLVEEGWCELVRASKDIASVDVWAHLVADVEFFQQLPREAWNSLLMQRYIISLLNAACLMELGIRNYAVDDGKTLEIRLYGEYYNEILNLDLQIGQIIRQMIDDYDDDAALSVADMKDDVINPIIADQYKVLALISEQIANSSVDIQVIKDKMDALDGKKREIGEVLMATRSSAV